jgi:hypothetical protein
LGGGAANARPAFYFSVDVMGINTLFPSCHRGVSNTQSERNENKMADNRKTYVVQKSTLEALGIELVIASKEYEKQLIARRDGFHSKEEYAEHKADQDFYKEQIEYLGGLINHLHEITNNELLLI